MTTEAVDDQFIDIVLEKGITEVYSHCCTKKLGSLHLDVFERRTSTSGPFEFLCGGFAQDLGKIVCIVSRK